MDRFILSLRSYFFQLELRLKDAQRTIKDGRDVGNTLSKIPLIGNSLQQTTNKILNGVVRMKGGERFLCRDDPMWCNTVEDAIFNYIRGVTDENALK